MMRIEVAFLLLALVFSVKASCPFSRQNAEQELNETVKDLESNDVADPETTTPNNCVCTSICSCGVGCDPGLPIPLGEQKTGVQQPTNVENIH